MHERRVRSVWFARLLWRWWRREVYACMDCGCLVADKVQHAKFHAGVTPRPHNPARQGWERVDVEIREGGLLPNVEPPQPAQPALDLLDHAD